MNFLVKKNHHIIYHCSCIVTFFYKSNENCLCYFFHILKAAFETCPYLMISESDTLFMSTDLIYMKKSILNLHQHVITTVYAHEA